MSRREIPTRPNRCCVCPGSSVVPFALCRREVLRHPLALRSGTMARAGVRCCPSIPIASHRLIAFPLPTDFPMSFRSTAILATKLLVAAWLPLYAVGLLFHFTIPTVAPDIPPQFGNAALFRPWAGWTSTYMALHPLAFGAIFVAVFCVLWRRGGVSPGWRGGLMYGLGVFLVGSLPVFLLAFAAFQVSSEVIVSWIVQSACQYLAAGATVGWAARSAKAVDTF